MRKIIVLYVYNIYTKYLTETFFTMIALQFYLFF